MNTATNTADRGIRSYPPGSSGKERLIMKITMSLQYTTYVFEVSGQELETIANVLGRGVAVESEYIAKGDDKYDERILVVQKDEKSALSRADIMLVTNRVVDKSDEGVPS